MSEAEEIRELIRQHGWMYVAWFRTGKSTGCDEYSQIAKSKQNIMDRIKSIITERDQLRKAAQSHRGKQ